MSIVFKSHGGEQRTQAEAEGLAVRAAPPPPGHIAADEQADFGFYFPPSADPGDYLPSDPATITELDGLGNLMVDAPLNPGAPEDSAHDSTLPPVLTYWGQFLDHELTLRTNDEGGVTSINTGHPPAATQVLEKDLKNARTPRFDLDSVYGGLPIGDAVTNDVVAVISGMRHPTSSAKMRVGTAVEPGPLPDALDEHRDLPRFGQAQQSVRDAALRVASASMSPVEFAKFEAGLLKRALIGDQRNDENLVVAQFHLSVLRFHNKAVDFLANNNTGWVADFHSAQTLTRLHYQWLIVEGYLKSLCLPHVVDKVIAQRAADFFKFRSEYDSRWPSDRLGNALPLEFAVAAYRFGHSMVRAAYDHNDTFGRPDGEATLDLLFNFTGGGGMFTFPKLPKNWVIDWNRFIGTAPLDSSDGKPARFARKIDTVLAPPLGELLKEGPPLADDPSDLNRLFKHLARRNLRRGYNMRLPTGQALHAYLKTNGAVASNPIADVSQLTKLRQPLKDFLETSQSQLHQRTPLWFYILAEAEEGGGNSLGEVGSWIVASTFIGVLLADPDSALSKGFTPSQSPLRMPDNSPVDTIAKWMQFALVMP